MGKEFFLRMSSWIGLKGLGGRPRTKAYRKLSPVTRGLNVVLESWVASLLTREPYDVMDSLWFMCKFRKDS